MTLASKAIYLTVLFLMINVSATITMELVKDSEGNRFFDNVPRQYDWGNTNDVLLQLNTTTAEFGDPIQSSGQLEDKGNQVYRVLDVMGLGFIMRTYDFITNHMYGIVNMLEGIFGPALDEHSDTLRETVFSTMRWAVFMLYLIAFVSIIANKRIAEAYK